MNYAYALISNTSIFIEFSIKLFQLNEMLAWQKKKLWVIETFQTFNDDSEEEKNSDVQMNMKLYAKCFVL